MIIQWSTVSAATILLFINFVMWSTTILYAIRYAWREQFYGSALVATCTLMVVGFIANMVSIILRSSELAAFGILVQYFGTIAIALAGLYMLRRHVDIE